MTLTQSIDETLAYFDEQFAHWSQEDRDGAQLCPGISGLTVGQLREIRAMLERADAPAVNPTGGGEARQRALRAFDYCRYSWQTKDGLGALHEQLGEIYPALTAQSPVTVEGWRPTHRHVKRRTQYMVLNTAIMQCVDGQYDDMPLVLYRDIAGNHWVRPVEEFNDGRFEAIPPDQGQQMEKEHDKT